MRKLLFAIITMLAVACASPYIPSIDNPTPPTNEDSDIIAYIDKRLAEEYYWLDEVEEKSASFNRSQQWENYLDDSLLKLTTNGDDGHANKDGSRPAQPKITSTGVFLKQTNNQKVAQRKGLPSNPMLWFEAKHQTA